MILNQFGFCRERKAGRKIFEADNIESDPGGVEFAGIKLIGGKQLGYKLTQLLELFGGDRLPVRVCGFSHSECEQAWLHSCPVGQRHNALLLRIRRYGLGDPGRLRFGRGRSWFVKRHEATPQRSEDNTEEKLRLD